MTKIGAKPRRGEAGARRTTGALRADAGRRPWGSEVCTRKTRILDVVYNASNKSSSAPARS